MTDLLPATEPTVSSYPLDDELVLYTQTDGQAYILNHTAARIWRLLDGTRSEAALAQEVAATYGQPYEQVLGDVQELLEHLRSVGLLTPAPDAG